MTVLPTGIVSKASTLSTLTRRDTFAIAAVALVSGGTATTGNRGIQYPETKFVPIVDWDGVPLDDGDGAAIGESAQ